MEIKNKLPNIYRKQKKTVSGYFLRVTKYANMHEVAIFQPWSRFMKRNYIILITILFNTPRVTYTQVGEFSVIIAKCSTEYIFISIRCIDILQRTSIQYLLKRNYFLLSHYVPTTSVLEHTLHFNKQTNVQLQWDHSIFVFWGILYAS